MAGILQPSIYLSSQSFDSSLPHRHMRTSPRPDGEPHDLPLGKDEEHDDGELQNVDPHDVERIGDQDEGYEWYQEREQIPILQI